MNQLLKLIINKDSYSEVIGYNSDLKRIIKKINRADVYAPRSSSEANFVQRCVQPHFKYDQKKIRKYERNYLSKL